jgi:hypothetical protein
MGKMSFYLKDPQATVDYAIDWALYLDGKAIVASAWSVAPAEAGGVAVEEASFDGTRTAVRASGGRAGHVYSLANQIALSDGSSDQRSVTLRVEQR